MYNCVIKMPRHELWDAIWRENNADDVVHQLVLHDAVVGGGGRHRGRGVHLQRIIQKVTEKRRQLVEGKLRHTRGKTAATKWDSFT